MSLHTGTHITDSSYACKYYWQATNVKGETVTLRIYKKNYSGAPLVYRICDLVSLKLNVQGDQGGVDQPIVKTSLQITLIDSYDAPAAAIGYEYIDGVRKYVYEKHGGWEEFFTPDATEYVVQVYVTANPDSEYSESRCVWQGYITPDSWHESLSYRGSVTIVARDNLGHLADFDFDLTGNDWGLVKVRDIIDGALTKINFPLRNYWAGENDFRAALYAVGADTSNDLGVLDLMVNVSAFEGLTWWDALESIIDSIGCVFRFTDYDAFTLMPLRHMPDMGWAEEEPKTIAPEMEFYGGSRMLDPGYKEIVEKIDFGQSDKLEYQSADIPKPGVNASTNQTFVLEFKNDHVIDPYGGQSSHTSSLQRSAPNATSMISKSIGNIRNLYNIIDPDAYDLQDYTKETEGEGFRNYLFLPANRGSMTINGSNVTINYTNSNWRFLVKTKSTQFKLKLEFATPAGFDDNGKLGAYPFKLWKVRYQIYYTKGGVTRHWTGDNWVDVSAGYYYIEKEYDPETEDVTSIEESLIECSDVGEYGTLYVIINYMVYRTVTYWWTYNGGWQLMIQASIGVYARLKSISMESELTKKMVSDTTKTVNNADYNVRCTRNPRFGCLSQSVGFVYPSNYQNAFFYMDDNGYPQAAPYLWKWSDRTTQLGFPVQVALQILQYHAVPLEVLEGSAGMVNKINRFTFDDAYLYKNVAHLILSGVYDFMTGRFDSVIFRAWTAFSNVSTRSAVAAAASTLDDEETEEQETETLEGVTPVRVSEAKLALLEKVATSEIAATVAEETEEQETAGAVTYLTPVLSRGTTLEITEGMEVERVFVERSIQEESAEIEED